MICLAAEPESGAVMRSDGASYHRNTTPQIARLGDGRLLTVWAVFGKNDSNGRIAGAFSADAGRTWAAPVLLIDDPKKMDGDPNILVDGNKVFVYSTRAGIPNRIDKAWTMVIHSEDNGAHWSEPQEIFIPRQYTPGKQHNAIKLSNNTYAMGISWDEWAERGMAARTEGEMNLSSGVLLSKDGLKWTLHGNVHAFMEKVTPGSTNGLCEPAIVELASGEILMYVRSGSSNHWESRSRDSGITWSSPMPSPLTGHNTPTALWRLQQNPQEIVAVWNNSPTHRFPLAIALSRDGGRVWSKARVLADPGGLQVSYPGITQANDGMMVVIWQQALADGGRDIRWARVPREWVLGIGR
ncbi:MAG: sialidase family protein [Bryobacteraceae bacterium]